MRVTGLQCAAAGGMIVSWAPDSRNRYSAHLTTQIPLYGRASALAGRFTQPADAGCG